MKKSLIGFFLIVGFVAAGLLTIGYFKATPGPGPNQTDFLPVIEITPDFFDFGEAVYGDTLQRVFLIKNSGNQTLEIKRVSTSCSCTSAKAVPEIIPPGAKAELTVSYDTGAMSGPHGRGEQERIIYIWSNDPINPQMEIIIHARVN